MYILLMNTLDEQESEREEKKKIFCGYQIRVTTACQKSNGILQCEVGMWLTKSNWDVTNSVGSPH